MAKRNSVQLVLDSSSATEEKLAEARLKLAALNREYEDMVCRNCELTNELL